MKINVFVVEEGEKGLHPFEVLLINGGQETKVGELTAVDNDVELDIEHPEAIVVRPLQA